MSNTLTPTPSFLREVGAVDDPKAMTDRKLFERVVKQLYADAYIALDLAGKARSAQARVDLEAAADYQFKLAEAMEERTR